MKNSIIYDIEDIEAFIDKNTTGTIIEHEGSIAFKLDKKYLEIDITECSEIPLKFEFRKKVDCGCSPDACIKEEKPTCSGCKFNNWSNIIEFKAEFMKASYNEVTKSKIAIYKVS